jgi:hypothetical protein
MILDNNSNKACVRDKAKGAINNVNTRRVKRDASPYNTFVTLKLALEPGKSNNASGL